MILILYFLRHDINNVVVSNCFILDKSIIGTNSHLFVGNGFNWSSNISPNLWHLSSSIKALNSYCLNSLFELEGLSPPINPPDKFTRSMQSIMSGTMVSPPWSMIMPQDEHRSFVERLINFTAQNLASINLSYYNDTWVRGNVVLKSLLPAKVDGKRFLEIIDDSGMNRRVIEGFRPDGQGLASPVVYDRFGTRTGRLTVKSGPGILTMKKEYRDVIVPSSPGGHIVSVDFSALEVRVLLHEAGGSCDSSDLYEHISNELFSGKVDRKSVKAAVIAESYGSGKSVLSTFLKIGGRELDDFVEKIRSYLGIKELRDRVSSQYWKEGHIRNKYGRRVTIDAPQGHIFVNSYAQSTGADVSLMGFSEVVQSLMKSPGVRPLFVVHDELILDVSPERMEDVGRITSVKVPGFEQIFPLKMRILR